MILKLSAQLFRNLIISHWNCVFMINSDRGQHLQFQRLFSPRRPYRVVLYWKSLPIVLRTSIGDRLGEFCLKYLKGYCWPFLMEMKFNNTMIVLIVEVMAIQKSLECQKRFTKALPDGFDWLLMPVACQHRNRGCRCPCVSFLIVRVCL